MKHTRERAKSMILLGLAVGLAVWAQRALADGGFVLDAVFAYGLGLICLLWALRGETAAQPGLDQQAAPEDGRRLPLLSDAWRWSTCIAGALLAVVAYRNFRGNTFRPANVVPWLGSIVACLLSFGEFRPGLVQRWEARLRGWRKGLRLSWPVLALVAILVMGAFLRYYQLDLVPAEMTSDHAEKLEDVQDVLDGKRPIFFTRNTGREPWQFYYTAALIRIFDWKVSHLSLKWGTAFIGVLTILATYLMAREMFDEEIGLLTAFFVAASKWHLALSRSALRFPFTALPLAMTLFFLVRGLKHGRRNDFLWCGLAMGIGLHGYTPFRIVPALAAGIIGLHVIFKTGPQWAVRRRLIANGLLTAAVAFLVFLPLMRIWMDSPRMFWYRSLSRSSDWERAVPQDTLRVFLSNLKNSLLMFNWKGDVVWMTNIPHVPALDVVTGGLFILGVAFAVFRLVRHRDEISLYLLLSTVVMLLPSTLSLAFPAENPSISRSGGSIPSTFVLVALPLALLARQIRTTLGRLPGMLVATLTIGLLLWTNVHYTVDYYFGPFAEQYRRSAGNATEIAEAIRGFTETLGDLDNVCSPVWPHWVDARNISINVGDITWVSTLPSVEDCMRRMDPKRNALFVLNREDEASLGKLEQTYPDGLARVHPSAVPGREFVLFMAPGQEQGGQ
jgi:hypothetical protein